MRSIWIIWCSALTDAYLAPKVSFSPHKFVKVRLGAGRDKKHSHHGVVKPKSHLRTKTKHPKRKHLTVVPMMFRETQSESPELQEKSAKRDKHPKATHRLLKFKSDSTDGRVHVWGQEETITVHDDPHPERFMQDEPAEDTQDEPAEDQIKEQNPADKDQDEIAEASEESEPSASGSVVNIYQGAAPDAEDAKIDNKDAKESKLAKAETIQGVIQNAGDQENEEMRQNANKEEVDLKDEEDAAEKEMKALIAEEKQEAANAQAEVTEAEKMLESETKRRQAKDDEFEKKENVVQKKKEAVEEKLEKKSHALENEIAEHVGALKKTEMNMQAQIDENDRALEAAKKKGQEDVAKVSRAEKQKEASVAAAQISKGCEELLEQKADEENCGECPCSGPHSYSVNPNKPKIDTAAKVPVIDVPSKAASPPPPMQAKAPLDLDKPACPEDVK